MLRALGRQDRRLTAGEIWTGLFEELLMDRLPPEARIRRALNTILAHGPVARRIEKALGRAPTATRVREVYRRLADCLIAGKQF